MVSHQCGLSSEILPWLGWVSPLVSHIVFHWESSLSFPRVNPQWTSKCTVKSQRKDCLSFNLHLASWVFPLTHILKCFWLFSFSHLVRRVLSYSKQDICKYCNQNCVDFHNPKKKVDQNYDVKGMGYTSVHGAWTGMLKNISVCKTWLIIKMLIAHTHTHTPHKHLLFFLPSQTKWQLVHLTNCWFFSRYIIHMLILTSKMPEIEMYENPSINWETWKVWLWRRGMESMVHKSTHETGTRIFTQFPALKVWFTYLHMKSGHEKYGLQTHPCSGDKNTYSIFCMKSRVYKPTHEAG